VLRYLFRRLIGAIFVMWVVAMLVFFMMRIVPGDPFEAMLFDSGDPAAAEELRKNLALTSLHIFSTSHGSGTYSMESLASQFTAAISPLDDLSRKRCQELCRLPHSLSFSQS